MLQRLRHRVHGQEGFTLIELLVVILIIGILAAVAIPVFLNQTTKANDANVKSNINAAATAEETYYTDNQSYTSANSDLTNINPALTDAFKATSSGGEGMTLTGDTDSYSITAADPSGITFTLSKGADGTTSYSCSTSGDTSATAGQSAGGCVVTSGTTGYWSGASNTNTSTTS